jgi:type IV secretion system protein VirD4
MFADPRRPISDLWAEMLTYGHIHGRNHPVVAASARDMIDRPSQEAGSVLSTTKSYLDLYQDPTIARNTSRSDFRIRDLMHYVDPVSLRSSFVQHVGAIASLTCLHSLPRPARCRYPRE